MTRPGHRTSGTARFAGYVGACAVAALAAGCGDGDGSSGREYRVEFRVTSSGRFGALQLEVEHLGSSGAFVGRGDKVDCVPLADAIVASNAMGERTLKLGMISLNGVPTPADVARCGFVTSEELTDESFDVEVLDASTTGGDPIDPPPAVAVSVSPR